VNNGYRDNEIAEMLNASMDGIYSSRMRNNICRESYSENKAIKLTEFQKKLLLVFYSGTDQHLKKIKMHLLNANTQWRKKIILYICILYLNH